VKAKLLDGPELLAYALRALSGRAMTAAEIRDKLHRRAAEPADVEEVLGKLKEAGFLDDARFAEAYASARRDNQGFGRMRVLRDLRARKVAPKVASDAVREAFEDQDEAAMAAQFLARKYRAVNLGEFLQEDKNLASAFRRLRTAGFGAGTAIRVLKRYASRAEELEDEPGGDDAA
jgi:regulatory protein